PSGPSRISDTQSPCLGGTGTDETDERDVLADVTTGGEVDTDMAKAKTILERPVAGDQLAHVRAEYGKYIIWYREVKWSAAMRRREAETLAQALDAFLLIDGIDFTESVGVEILCRRWAGLVLLEEGQPSGVADALAYKSSQGVVPRAVLQAAMK